MTIIVAKFGGTSVANFDAMQHAAAIVKNNKNTKIVVLSACSKVTDLLVKLSFGVEEQERKEILERVAQIHFAIVDQLKLDAAQLEVLTSKLNGYLDEIAQLAKSAELATNNALADAIVSHGELMSSSIFCYLLEQQGSNAVWLDARNIVKTDSNFGSATYDFNATHKNYLKLEKLLDQDDVKIITQGFIASDSEGKTTTLGRGGSDYSAAIFSELTNAKILQIWTDVPGIFTTDPRIVANAKRIDAISFAEASEMATFGAKILHPSTLLPAVRANIPVFVGNTFAAEQPGTLISKNVENKPLYRGIAIRRGQILITISSLKMLHISGFLAKVFAIIASYDLAIDVVTTSEVSIAMTIDKTSNTSGINEISNELLEELSLLGKVKVERDLSLVALIGNELNSRAVLGDVFAQLDYPIRSISQGASQHNICILLENQYVDQIVAKLHKKLFD